MIRAKTRRTAVPARTPITANVEKPLLLLLDIDVADVSAGAGTLVT